MALRAELLTFRREGASAEASNRLLQAIQAAEGLGGQLAGLEPAEEEEAEEIPSGGFSLTPKLCRTRRRAEDGG